MTDEHTQAVETEAPEASLWSRIKLSAGILALALLLLFMAQNLQRVNIHFLWFDWHTRLLWALLVAAAFGGISTIVAGALVRRREHRAEKR
jgi:uncharacterized integral membrane protein